MPEAAASVKMLYDEYLLPQDLHMPGIGPYIAGYLKQHKLGLVLDVGVDLNADSARAALALKRVCLA